MVPATLLIIFRPPYVHFRSVAESPLVMLSLPFALVGGVVCMWLPGYHPSVAAPMVGGMVSSTVLTRVVVSAAYALWREWEPRRCAVTRGPLPHAAAPRGARG